MDAIKKYITGYNMEFLKSIAEIEYEITHPEEEEEEENRFINTNYIYGGTESTKTSV